MLCQLLTHTGDNETTRVQIKVAAQCTSAVKGGPESITMCQMTAATRYLDTQMKNIVARCECSLMTQSGPTATLEIENVNVVVTHTAFTPIVGSL